MVGYPAVSVMADLVAKNLVTDDLNVWAEAGARSSVYRDDLAAKFKGTRELDLITRHPHFKETLGYVPADSVPESVSWGVEMAYYDWCISEIARKAGNQELAETYQKKGEYYKRYLDPETKMMRPIMADGSFRTPFNPRYSAHMKSDYTEGNAFQWSFFVPHDMDNFIAAIGGKQELETRLDTLFTTSSQIDGAEASVENINNGSYKISRPFNIAVKDNLSAVATDFVNHILSDEGQNVIAANKYIKVKTSGSFQTKAPKGKVVVAGSSSVSPVMEKLIEAYKKINPNATLELQTSDSTTGVTNAINGTCDIGMASRSLKSSEKEKGVNEVTIAIDGIAVIVNQEIPTVGLTKAQVESIFTGKVEKWNKIN